MRLLLFLVVVVGTAGALSPLFKSKDAVPNRYIVKLKDDADLERVLDKVEFAAALDRTIKVTHTFKHVFKGFSARLTSELLETIRNLDVVEYVEEDSIVKIAGVASWGLDRVDQLELPLDDVYSPIGDGTGVHVYVLDTGINEGHEDFGGRASNVHDTVGDGQDGVDCHGHGTHCCGTVGGTYFGVAKASNIYGIRVLNCDGAGSTAGIVAGCEWVVANAIRPAVGSMSLGGLASITMDNGVQAMIDNGIQVAVAAGNENTNACVKSPARVPEAITVGATDSNDTRASFSNYGTCVDIFAPGVDITSAWIGSNNYINTISGTSMATPHVAGAAAILLSIDNQLSPEQIKEMLQEKSIADKVTDEKPGSPNLLLYIGEGSGGGYIPSPPPTSTPCGAQITANGTLLTSPNYPNNYNNDDECQYNIEARKPGLAVGIIFSYFDVEYHHTCDYDALTIYDGTSSSDTLIANLCGDSIPTPVYTTGQNMYLKFKTDLSGRKIGFFSNVYFYDADTVPTNAPLPVAVTTVPPTTLPPTSAPCGISGPITTSGTNVTSPGWPNDYSNNLDCSTQIRASDGQAIKLTFHSFSVEYSPTCAYDKLEIYNGDSTSSGKVGSYCGSTIPSPKYSSGSSMLLVFSSDGSVTAQGYFGTVTFIDQSEVPTQGPSTIPPTTLPPTSAPCSAGGPIDTSGSAVTSPGWPSDYGTDIHCSTKIHASDGQTIMLSFSTFEMEGSAGSCHFNRLTIYDGDSTASEELAVLCGSTIPATVYSTGPSMLLEFYSDVSLTYQGYYGTVTFIDELQVNISPRPPPVTDCGSKTTDPSGDVFTPGYPSPYESDVDCTIHIHSEDATKTVTLTFNAFDLEYDASCNFDSVSVYDGVDENAAMLGKFCGSSLPPPVSSSGPDMFVKFHSDASVTANGVHATYIIS